MGTDNAVFLEILEWFDESGTEMVHRIPEGGSGEIKYGAQLVVRESQAAVFFYKGRALDVFGPGRHTLTTANIPILTKILSLPWAMKSPLRAEVYFVNMKVFAGVKWGTSEPVAFRDGELGLIRLRAFGILNIQVVQPVLFINSLVGTQGIYTTEQIERYLGSVVVSRFNDYLGEHLESIISLPGTYDDMASGLLTELQKDFAQFGLALPQLYISSITPPLEVQKAIDDKSKLGIFDDLNKLLRLKAAMAMEKASENQTEAGSGFGMGLGFMMPAMFGNAMKTDDSLPTGPEEVHCPDCRLPVPREGKFCPHCGHQIVVFQRCRSCGKNAPPNARYCPACGREMNEPLSAKRCNGCGADNLVQALFCNQCGSKLP